MSINVSVLMNFQLCPKLWMCLLRRCVNRNLERVHLHQRYPNYDLNNSISTSMLPSEIFTCISYRNIDGLGYEELYKSCILATIYCPRHGNFNLNITYHKVVLIYSLTCCTLICLSFVDNYISWLILITPKCMRNLFNFPVKHIMS